MPKIPPKKSLAERLGYARVPKPENVTRSSVTDNGLGNCAQCGVEFPRRKVNQKYCGEDCRKAAYVARRREKLKAQRAAQRKDDPLHGKSSCEECGRFFTMKRKDQQFCSAKCKQRAWRWMKAFDGS